MINKIVLASNNEHKIKEFNEMFSCFNVEVISLKEAGINSSPIEDGLTFLDNSLIKAKDVALKTNLPVISDDSGLEIKGLDGFPGVYSARFMEGHSYEEKCAELLKRLQDKNDKTACYKVVLCLIINKDEPLFFEGRVDGKIVSPKGSNGFGYDPIFYSYDLNKRFAEATPEEKNSVSHRGRALQKLVKYLLNTEQISRK